MNTFKNNKNKRLKSFREIGNEINNHTPIKIKDSGYRLSSKFWLNVRDLSSNGFSKGSITVAINDWEEHFSVR